MMLSTRWVAVGLATLAVMGGATTVLVSKPASALAGTNEVVVYKSPSCGCCAKWVDHLKQHGFTVKVEDTDELTAVKQRFGIGMHLAACHTAVVGDFIVEGHVPADVIQKFLAEPPEGAIGLAVPGMPAGSPGMESARPQPYDILTFDKSGATKVFAKR